MKIDLGLVNKTDDTHFARALGADKRICFVHLSDELRPALERLTPGFMAHLERSGSCVPCKPLLGTDDASADELTFDKP